MTTRENYEAQRSATGSAFLAKRPDNSAREPPIKGITHILHLSSNVADCKSAVDALQSAGITVEVEAVHTISDFSEGLVHPKLNLILSDYAVPGVDPPEALCLVRHRRPEIPFVFLSASIGDELAVETLKQRRHKFRAQRTLVTVGTGRPRSFGQG